MAAKKPTKDSTKQVVYIDAQDDIAGLIETVEASEKKIVALVLPKRPEVLSSIVNMKLLRESGGQFEKRIVLITNDKAVLAIAANIKMYVAPNLNSAPAIPKENAIVIEEPEPEPDTPAQDQPSDSTDQPQSKVKVPNFSRLVKRLLLVGTVLVLLPLLWFIGFRVLPKATINIVTDFELLEDVSFSIELSTELRRINPNRSAIPFYLETHEQTLSQTIEASGEKEVGAHASGLVTIKNCSDDTISIAAGTPFTADGLIYTNQEPINDIKSGHFNSRRICTDDVTRDHIKTFTVTAQEVGERYNHPGTSRTYSPTGIPDINADEGGYITGSAMTGGSQEVVKFVTQADLDGANSNLALKQSDQDAKVQLERQLKDQGLIPLGDTFRVEAKEVESDVVVDQETEEGVIKQTINYQLGGISQQDLQEFLHPVLIARANGLNLINDGLDQAHYSLKVVDEQTYDLTVRVDAQVGFSLDVETIFEQIKGRPADQVAQELRSQDGVIEVSVSVTPPWTNNVPKERDKVMIEISDND